MSLTPPKPSLEPTPRIVSWLQSPAPGSAWPQLSADFQNKINKMKLMFRKTIGRGASFLFPKVFAALLFAAVHATAATVGPAGYTNGFNVRPPATDWATLSISGGSGDAYTPDAEVNASVTASGVTAQTVFDAGNPPVANASAVYAAGLYLQTRPTMNRATVLMGKFVNNTGTNATQIALSYLFTIAAGGVPEENGKGTRVYFSLTGQANSWTNVPALNTTASAAVAIVASHSPGR
jgi:hypothetical protein